MTTLNYSSFELSQGAKIWGTSKNIMKWPVLCSPLPQAVKWPSGWNSPASQNPFQGVLCTRITSPHKHCPTFIPPSSTTHRGKCSGCKGRLPASIQKLPVSISRNYSFWFPIIIMGKQKDASQGITRRREWEKRDHQLFPKLTADLSGRCLTPGRETAGV